MHAAMMENNRHRLARSIDNAHHASNWKSSLIVLWVNLLLMNRVKSEARGYCWPKGNKLWISAQIMSFSLLDSFHPNLGLGLELKRQQYSNCLLGGWQAIMVDWASHAQSTSCGWPQQTDPFAFLHLDWKGPLPHPFRDFLKINLTLWTDLSITASAMLLEHYLFQINYKSNK